jgi:hypothetical protein
MHGAVQLLGWLLTAFAAAASLDTVATLRTASFIAGGTAHVIALGIFVLLASGIPGFGKPVRVFAIIAAVPAIASLVSLAWFQGAALILLGRLLCMAWIISAATCSGYGRGERPTRRLSAVLQQERDQHLRPALVLRVRRGEGGREVPLFDDPAEIEVRDQHRDDDQAEQVVDQRGPQYRR